MIADPIHPGRAVPARSGTGPLQLLRRLLRRRQMGSPIHGGTGRADTAARHGTRTQDPAVGIALALLATTQS